MANVSYMSLRGKRQGLISAGCSGVSSIDNRCQVHHEDESVELCRHDHINYERAYRQMGRLALTFEALTDGMTILSIGEEKLRQNQINE